MYSYDSFYIHLYITDPKNWNNLSIYLNVINTYK